MMALIERLIARLNGSPSLRAHLLRQRAQVLGGGVMRASIVFLIVIAIAATSSAQGPGGPGPGEHNHTETTAKPRELVSADQQPPGKNEVRIESKDGFRVITPVNPAFFVKDGLIGEIKTEERKLSDGSTALCYVIKTNTTPSDHKMGPWSPKHVSDGNENGGIWFKDGEVYDVDGAFVANLAVFYNDPGWKIVREDGSIRVTDTKAAFEAAARPDVDPKYNNYVVEGDPAWYPAVTTTYVVPVRPVYNEKPTGMFHGPLGVALNGVRYDPPAPVDMILRAHTLAPLDHGGGHLNPHEGYHYHAATGKSTEVAQEDGHAPLIGYALDGFAIYAHHDAKGNDPVDLDECGGHADSTRGYHYHAGPVGGNQVIKAFRGTPGQVTVEGLENEAHPRGGPPGGADGGRPPGPPPN